MADALRGRELARFHDHPHPMHRRRDGTTDTRPGKGPGWEQLVSLLRCRCRRWRSIRRPDQKSGNPAATDGFIQGPKRPRPHGSWVSDHGYPADEFHWGGAGPRSPIEHTQSDRLATNGPAAGAPLPSRDQGRNTITTARQSRSRQHNGNGPPTGESSPATSVADGWSHESSTVTPVEFTEPEHTRVAAEQHPPSGDHSDSGIRELRTPFDPHPTEHSTSDAATNS